MSLRVFEAGFYSKNKGMEDKELTKECEQEIGILKNKHKSAEIRRRSVRRCSDKGLLEDLKEREAQLQAIIRAFDGLLYVCSSDYLIEFMNERHIKYIGYDASGELCYKAMRNSDSVCPWCVNERVFKGETIRRETKGKDNRWYEVVHAPIFNADGNVSALIMGIDITEYKEMEDSLKEKVRIQREASLIKAKLIHANKMASLGVLASGIAHEINNPNNFIMNNASILSDVCQDAIKIMTEYHRENGDFFVGGLPFAEIRNILPNLISGITEGSKRIKNIVDNLKVFYRNDGRMDERVNINDVINASILILSNKIRNYTRGFHLDLKKDIPEIKGSFQQIEQIIINLLTNAMEAIPDKKGGIYISTSHDRDKDHVVVKVKDEGIGMTRNILESITEPFFTTRLDKGGTGLGLSISRSIIKEHSGSLEFESESGKGTTVIVTLPVYKEI